MAQADIGQIRNPKLVGRGDVHLGGKVRVHRQTMVAAGGCHEPLFAQAEQIVFSHEAQNALVVCLDALPMQLFCDAMVAISRLSQHHLLNLFAQCIGGFGCLSCGAAAGSLRLFLRL